ncbi:alanyl-tRNA synthetase [Pedobacter chitinilyticus]|uniref:Alanyl-tRNA synthetase n=1 Tax=Pedobacter chitinilyticus TaxID=2233776 RepID=A0A3S3PW61_9SPHI|nr:alanyl-tRNA synthetase [Pedobacter chitinilyticus]RWU10854.1 alanyl-tRNA synthetase [Pedobacter chitinilyticus]
MNAEKVEKFKKWIKKIGFWGFLFFLVKGLVWLAVGYFIVK